MRYRDRKSVFFAFVHSFYGVKFFKGEDVVKAKMLRFKSFNVRRYLLRCEMRHFANDKIGFVFHWIEREIVLCKPLRHISREKKLLALCLNKNRVAGARLDLLGPEVGYLNVFILVYKTLVCHTHIYTVGGVGHSVLHDLSKSCYRVAVLLFGHINDRV